MTKRVKKKEELAAFAIETMSELGYARTSLRDIAKSSDMSVGVLHYYFEDKIHLLTFCVRQFKEQFIADMGKFTLESGDRILKGFIDGLSEAIQFESGIHCLWYDIRNQALFEQGFQQVAVEIEEAMINVIVELLAALDKPPEWLMPIYLFIDGTFRFYLQKFRLGDLNAHEEFVAFMLPELESLVENGRFSGEAAKARGKIA